MSKTSTTEARPGVDFAALGRELGLDPYVRHDMLREGLVTPTRPPHRGRPTEITPESAERVRAAVLLAVYGLAAIVVLRLLAKSGANVTPSGVTIPVPSTL
jgi:hypothetical protein